MTVKITETVLRDGHQSLIATRMATADMLPILEKLDAVGYFSLEMWGGATFDVCMRFLNEDPWGRLRIIRQHVKNTKLQMLLRGQNLVGYRHYPDDVVVRFVEKAKENGIDIFRIFDALNDIRNMTTAIKAAKKVGAIVEGSISYTVSPVHTIEKYLKFAIELKELGADIICIKDMAGLISPAAAFDLVNHLKKEVKLPVHLHSHCTSGMAPIAYLTACEAGVDILDTVISPFGWGSSQPPTETIVGALKDTPYDTGLDLNKLIEIAEYFQKVRQRYRSILDPIAERVDARIMVHQIPGGMLSNLISQLKEQNAVDKYDAVLKETALVRKDLGYPPLVTPTSQIVGTQAVVNVITGARYKVVPREVKDYLKGLYGAPPGPVDEELQKKILGGEEPIKGRPADGLPPGLEPAREAVKDYNPTDEDVLSYAIFPQVAKDFFERRKQGIGPTPAVAEENIGSRNDKSIDQQTNKSVATVQMAHGKDPAEYVVTLEQEVASSATHRRGEKHAVKVSRSAGSPDETLYVDINGNRFVVNLNKPVETAVRPPEPVVKTAPPPPPAPKLEIPKPVPKPAGSVTLRDIIVPMPGKVVDIKVKVGDAVKVGEVLFILEAMKMQNEISAPVDGTVSEMTIQVGMNVDNIAPVMRLSPG